MRFWLNLIPRPNDALFSRKLAGEAKAQAAIWAAEARKIAGETPEGFRPSARARFVAALVRRLGPERLRERARRDEGPRDVDLPQELARSERARDAPLGRGGRVGATATRAAATTCGRRSSGPATAWCRTSASSSASRARSASSHTVLITGVAGLLAGAFSMAAGEYVSVRSQREMFEHQIGAERDELQQYPEQEAAELSLIYQARGLPKPDADRDRDPPHRRSRAGRSTRWRGRSWGSIRAALGSPVGAALVVVRVVCGRRRGSARRRSCSPRGAGRSAASVTLDGGRAVRRSAARSASSPAAAPFAAAPGCCSSAARRAA